MGIDWGFIATLEGDRLSGYVPDPEGSVSGVTVGTGVDLGQFGPVELEALPAPLQATLKPYLGLRGATAAAFLKAQPLTLSGADVDALDVVVEGVDVAPLRSQYLLATKTAFDSLPGAAQTVMASVTFQYGTPWKRCPQFWNSCVAKNWRGVVATLNNFGDRYETRRKAEAVYLLKSLTPP